MVQIKVEPDIELVNFLRSNLTDINSSRSGQWIFPDFPRVQDLGDASYPRIGVTVLSNSSQPSGIIDTDVYEEIVFQIDIVTKKDLGFSVTTTDEALGTMSSTINSDRITYEYVPTSITNIKHNGSAYAGTITLQTTDSDFTTPASLTADSVEVSKSTGNLNFSATDVTNHDGEAITSTSVIYLEGKKQVKYLAREVVKLIKTNWRTGLTGLFNPVMISNTTLPFEEELGLFRQTLEYRFNGFNLGSGI